MLLAQWFQNGFKKGKLIDKDSDAPIPNVSVGIEELKIITETNQQGEFFFKEITKQFGIYR